MIKVNVVLIFGLLLCAGESAAQVSQTTHVQGTTKIDVSTEDTTAIAKGENSVARNRIGVIKGSKNEGTKITVNAAHVTTVVSGNNKKVCTNIGGVVSDECK